MALEKRKGRPRSTQPLDNGPVAGHQPAHNAKGLAERADFDLHTSMEAKVVNDTPAAFPEHALAVRVINHEQDAVFFGHVANRVQRGQVAVHAKDAVGHDQLPAAGLGFGDLAPQIVHIGVGIAHGRGAAEATGVDD